MKCCEKRAEQGFTVSEVAKELGIARSTLRRWIDKYAKDKYKILLCENGLKKVRK